MWEDAGNLGGELYWSAVVQVLLDGGRKVGDRHRFFGGHDVAGGRVVMVVDVMGCMMHVLSC